MLYEDLLLLNNARIVKYKKGETIFEEGSKPRFYYQILEGTVRMINYKEDGKIFIQGSFEKNESFGEPPLFINQCFPASARAITDCEIIQMVKESFFELLEANPKLYFNFVVTLSNRLHNKATSNKFLSQSQPETRIIAFLQNIRNQNNLNLSSFDKVLITLTRQEIADSVGLRVETVIRAMKKMQKNNEIEIRNHKIYI